MTLQEFRELYAAVSTWGHREIDGRRGALRHLTSARTAAAAQLVHTGSTVTLGRPLATEALMDVPQSTSPLVLAGALTLLVQRRLATRRGEWIRRRDQ
jgi:hypothetical protein